MNRFLRLLLVPLLLLLNGCLTLPVATTERPAPEDVTVFAFNGRIAVKQGETRYYAKLDWRHDETGDAIILTTPLGQGVAEIVRDASGARLTLADRRRYEAADWGALAQQIFGFHLPLAGSERWLLGTTAVVDGWLLTVHQRENDLPDGLPTLIELERDDIAVRLKIDDWSEVR